MRILFIAHYFQPEPNFFFGLPFALKLKELGHDVEVLTGFPNYPGGKLYDGYHIRFHQKEDMDGIPVHRLPLYPSHDRSSLKRILCYSSLALSQAALGPFHIRKADIAYICQGPATLGLPGIIFKCLKGIPFVYHIQDLWPDSLTSTGMFHHSAGLKWVHRWCNFVYRQAAKIVVITPGMKKRLIERGVPEEKIDIIYNWCDDSQIHRSPRDPELGQKYGLLDRFNVVFAGNMGKAQAMDTILDAARLLRDKLPQVQFVLIGGGVDVDSLKQRTTEMDLANVRFIPRQPVSQIGSFLAWANALLVHLRDDPLFEITIPSKTQAYLATGRPIIIAVKGDAADLVRQARAGIACEPENAQGLVQAIEQLASISDRQRVEMGQNGIAFYEQKLSFNIGAYKFNDIFQQIASRN